MCGERKSCQKFDLKGTGSQDKIQIFCENEQLE